MNLPSANPMNSCQHTFGMQIGIETGRKGAWELWALTQFVCYAPPICVCVPFQNFALLKMLKTTNWPRHSPRREFSQGITFCAAAAAVQLKFAHFGARWSLGGTAKWWGELEYNQWEESVSARETWRAWGEAKLTASKGNESHIPISPIIRENSIHFLDQWQQQVVGGKKGRWQIGVCIWFEVWHDGKR